MYRLSFSSICLNCSRVASQGRRSIITRTTVSESLSRVMRSTTAGFCTPVSPNSAIICSRVSFSKDGLGPDLTRAQPARASLDGGRGGGVSGQPRVAPEHDAEPFEGGPVSVVEIVVVPARQKLFAREVRISGANRGIHDVDAIGG